MEGWTSQYSRSGGAYVREDWKYRVRQNAKGHWYVQRKAAPGRGWEVASTTGYDTAENCISTVPIIERQDAAKHGDS